MEDSKTTSSVQKDEVESSDSEKLSHVIIALGGFRMIDVMILSTPYCVKCESAKKLFQRLKSEFQLNIKEYDVSERPELLQKFPFFSAPGIVINNKLEFTGIPFEEEVRKKLSNYALMQGNSDMNMMNDAMMK